MAVFGAFRGAAAAAYSFTTPMVDMENDVYSQIGLGDADQSRSEERNLDRRVRQGTNTRKAGRWPMRAGRRRLRLRPILMTSLAFVFGCITLWLASGAGSVARRVMGTTVIGGMLARARSASSLFPQFLFCGETRGRKATRTSVPSAIVKPIETN